MFFVQSGLLASCQNLCWASLSSWPRNRTWAWPTSSPSPPTVRPSPPKTLKWDRQRFPSHHILSFLQATAVTWTKLMWSVSIRSCQRLKERKTWDRRWISRSCTFMQMRISLYYIFSFFFLIIRQTIALPSNLSLRRSLCLLLWHYLYHLCFFRLCAHLLSWWEAMESVTTAQTVSIFRSMLQTALALATKCE